MFLCLLCDVVVKVTTGVICFYVLCDVVVQVTTRVLRLFVLCVTLSLK